MPTLRERLDKMVAEKETLAFFFGPTGWFEKHGKVISDDENRLELECRTVTLVIRPWGWTYYICDEIEASGDFDD